MLAEPADNLAKLAPPALAAPQWGVELAPLFIATALAAASAALYLQRLLHRHRGSRRARRRSARAQRGEHDAEALVSSLGYEISARQARLDWIIDVDGEPMTVELRADLLVERDGKRFVAEVKTGDKAPKLSHAATRRQLLEYRCAYPVDGVVLVDVEAGWVSEVGFPLPAGAAEPRRPSAATVHVGVAALIGLLTGAIIVWMVS